MDQIQICEIKYSFASDYTFDKVSEENYVKGGNQATWKGIKQQNFKKSEFSCVTFYCSAPVYFCN